MGITEFKANVQRISADIGVRVKEIHMRKMSRKWASCSSKGRLTFDPALLKETPEKRIETVLHELLHLRYPNHGRMFQRMLGVYREKYR
ncbi:MAG: M48 family metallopeptidase [Spirochaetales bacterium]|nr:M48 family metallopeptidase [Spirochaetales bacterium]